MTPPDDFKPTEPGFYWYRANGHDAMPPAVVALTKQKTIILHAQAKHYSLDECLENGRFLSYRLPWPDEGNGLDWLGNDTNGN